MDPALREQLTPVLDFTKARLLMDPMQDQCTVDEVKRLEQGETIHVTAALYDMASHRRYMTARKEDLPALYYSTLPFDGPYHRHTTYELTYVISGRFSYWMSGREVVLQAGEAILMDLNCVHFDRNLAENAAVLFLLLPSHTFRRFAELFPDRTAARLTACQEDPAQRYLFYRPASGQTRVDTERRFAELLQETVSEEYGSQEMLFLLSARLLLFLEESCDATLVTSANNVKKDLVLIEIDRYIQDNLATVTLEKLTGRFHFNDAWFSRKIKQKYGVTLTRYLQQKRVERACQLLTGTGLTVLEIVEAVGYQNDRYFYQLFKQSTGMTLAEYRTRMAGVGPGTPPEEKVDRTSQAQYTDGRKQRTTQKKKRRQEHEKV